MTDTSENTAEPPKPTDWEPNWTDQVGQLDTTGVGAGKNADLRNITAVPDMFDASVANRTENPANREPRDPELEGPSPLDVPPTGDFAAVQDTTGDLPTQKGEDWIDPAAHVKDPSLVEAGDPANAPPVDPTSSASVGDTTPEPVSETSVTEEPSGATVDTTDAGVSGPTPPLEEAEAPSGESDDGDGTAEDGEPVEETSEPVEDAPQVGTVDTTDAGVDGPTAPDESALVDNPETPRVDESDPQTAADLAGVKASVDASPPSPTSSESPANPPAEAAPEAAEGAGDAETGDDEAKTDNASEGTSQPESGEGSKPAEGSAY
jgi:hypothetical protein